jgi:hypothetical protein
MYVSGTNFRLVPEVSAMHLTFGGLILFGTGRAEIGVSGNNNRLAFLFSGNRIKSPEGRFIGAYNTGEPIDFEWTIDSTNHYYGFNGNVIKKNNSKADFNIQRFFVNTTGVNISADAKFYCESIGFSLDFDDNFYALSRLTGRLTNNSSPKFRIFDSSLTFYSTIGTPLTGRVSGTVTGNTDFVFSLADNNTSRFDSSVHFFSTFHTAIGIISGIFDANRVSGLDLIVSTITTDDSGILLTSLFDGSGVSGNRFTFVKTPATHLSSYYCSSTNLKGESKTKTVTIKFEPVAPIASGLYESNYVTGFTLVSGGEYAYPPSLKITGYYYVSGLNWSLNSILLSSGCSGDLPVIFSGNPHGRNASGVLKSTRTLLSGVYGESLAYYYLPQSFEIISGGTGYVSSPRGYLRTGIYSNCYDVGAKYNTSYLIYKPFVGSGHLGYQSAYLTGEVLVTTGFVSGGSGTGYRVTGIEFTNIGSGYNSGLFPRCEFVRQTGDVLTANATGNFTMKHTGLYLFTGSWALSTGLSTFDLVEMNGFTGTGYLSEVDNYFAVQISYTGLDATQNLIGKLTVTMSGAENALVNYVTGSQRYDTSTGFLKKKNSIDLILYDTTSDLSFLLTQDDLDNYYSSEEYMNTGDLINLGDLEF